MKTYATSLSSSICDFISYYPMLKLYTYISKESHVNAFYCNATLRLQGACGSCLTGHSLIWSLMSDKSDRMNPIYKTA